MELKEVIKKRHSTRHFTNQIPPSEVIREILEYANLAPSAGNLKARDFIIVTKPIVLYSAAFNQITIKEAPIAIVVCADTERVGYYGDRGKNLFCIQDASVAAEHILLMAEDYGLGACWVGAFDEDKVKEILKISDDLRPVAIIAIGYERKP